MGPLVRLKGLEIASSKKIYRKVEQSVAIFVISIS